MFTPNGAAFSRTVAAGLAGALIDGGLFDSAPQETAGVPLLRGFGVLAVTVKSLPLLFVSVQPLLMRMTAVLLPGAAVGAVPSKQFAVGPYPTRSAMDGSVGHETEIVATEASATFPAPAPTVSVPVASGAGRSTVPPAP